MCRRLSVKPELGADGRGGQTRRSPEDRRTSQRLATHGFPGLSEAYPEIKIEYVSIGTHGQADARLKSEWEAKVFDWDILASGQQFIYSDLVATNALVPIRDVVTRDDVKDTTAWAGGFEASFLDKEQSYVFGFMIYIAEIAYVETRAYPLSTFKSVRDLLDPKYKGKIAWVDPRTGGVIDVMTGFVYQRLGADGLRYLLTEQNPHIVGTSRQLLEAMLRAGKPIGIGVTTGTLRQMREAGLGDSVERIDFPDGRQVGRSGGFIAVPRPLRIRTPRCFTNWLLSREGQTIWVKLTKENSARSDVPVGDPLRNPDPKLDWFTWDKEEVDFLDKYQIPARKIAVEMLGSQSSVDLAAVVPFDGARL